MTKHENWVGRGCCHLILHPVCRTACALAGSRSHLQSTSCRESDEIEFYSCLERREDGDRCCSNVANVTCRVACRELFHKRGKGASLKLYTSKGCFHQVPKCLKRAVESPHVENPKQCTLNNFKLIFLPQQKFIF